MKKLVFVAAVMTALVVPAFAQGQAENFESWPVLKSTFPSTGGGGVMIKGYDPVITEGKCVTTFMATDNGKVYFNIVEFETVAVQGGTLCTNAIAVTAISASSPTPSPISSENAWRIRKWLSR
mgnify:CR=1 FL=1